LKDVGSPTQFLGAKIGKEVVNGTEYWYISTKAYLEKALAAIEERFGKLDSLFGKSQLDTPVPTNFHPEIDNSDFLD
jgi:hypothetical protein